MIKFSLIFLTLLATPQIAKANERPWYYVGILEGVPITFRFETLSKCTYIRNDAERQRIIPLTPCLKEG